MARPKTDQFWVQRIYEARANGPQITSKQIEAALQAEGERVGKRGWPTERTIRNLVKGFEQLSESEQVAYRYFSWPASMGTADLPWEASETCLELLRSYPTARPRVGLVKWYWRLSQALPRASFEIRSTLAGQMDFAERHGVLAMAGESVGKALVDQDPVDEAYADILLREFGLQTVREDG
jgi:hypothetical protein